MHRVTSILDAVVSALDATVSGIHTIIDATATAINTAVYAYKFYTFYRYSGCHDKTSSLETHCDNFYTKRLRQHEKAHCLATTTLGDLKTFCDLSGKEPQIPEIGISDATKETFDRVSHGRTRPAVIRGYGRTCKSARWGPEFFSRVGVGDTAVLTLMPTKEQTTREYTTFTESIPLETLSLRNNVKKMLDGTGGYINNVTSLFVDRPELVDDLELHRLRHITSSVNESNWLKLNMFMGGSGTKSSLHCAAAGNFFHNICGRKKWTLIEPRFSKFLGPTPSKNFSFVISEHAHIPKDLPRYEVVLEPGDVFFNPPWWWHKVENLDDFTVGVAVRDHQTYWQSWANNPLYMMLSPYVYRLHPFVLWLADKLYGRAYLVDESMKSGTHVNECLSGET